MPVLAVAGSIIQHSEVMLLINVTRLYAMKTLAQNVQGIQVPNSGHWIPEERPDIIIKLLDNFFGGNTTKTIK